MSALAADFTAPSISYTALAPVLVISIANVLYQFPQVGTTGRFELIPDNVVDDDLLLGRGDAKILIKFRIEVDLDFDMAILILKLRRERAVARRSLAGGRRRSVGR